MIPLNWSQVPVTWDIGLTNGVLTNGQVWFTPSQKVTYGDGDTFVLEPVMTRIYAGVMTPVSLVSTDDPDATPGGWSWKVTTILGANDRTSIPPFHIQVPHDAATIDLATAVPVVPSPLMPTDAASLRAELVALINSGSVAGKSAFDIAVENGFLGTVEQWLDSLHGSGTAEEYPDFTLIFENGLI